MRILVTGANGYLGRGIVKHIITRGEEVITTDFKMYNRNCRMKIHECNLFEIDDPYEYFEKPDVLLHLAWRDGFVHNSDAHIIDLPKHYIFIKKMCESGIKQVAIMGSMHEVGFHEGSINDLTPCHPMSLYGVGKDTLRNIVEQLTKQNNLIFQWLRGYYIVGNSEYGSSIFSKITAAEIEGKKEFPFTSGQNQYDFLDYEEFCEQVACAVCQNSVTGIINICSGKPQKLADRVEQFIKENNYSIKLKYGAFPDRTYDSKAVWGDGKKIDSILKNTEKGKVNQIDVNEMNNYE